MKDKIPSAVPCKGQVLNLASVYWFQETINEYHAGRAETLLAETDPKGA